MKTKRNQAKTQKQQAIKNAKKNYQTRSKNTLVLKRVDCRFFEFEVKNIDWFIWPLKSFHRGLSPLEKRCLTICPLNYVWQIDRQLSKKHINNLKKIIPEAPPEKPEIASKPVLKTRWWTSAANTPGNTTYVCLFDPFTGGFSWFLTKSRENKIKAQFTGVI